MNPRLHPLVPVIALLCLTLIACAPEVGSERWCETMQDKPRGEGEWTMNETAKFARHCLLPDTASDVGSERWCRAMRDKPKGEWSINDAVDFTRHCLFSGATTGEG